ncbi:hypothetical protein GMORB2_6449 [Geosmithia morbida]|uniref:Uncharacterized protein n=1 Tax=Geosmithia morbida TaxID=1094350 RepID=A0A9P4YXZ6_9HYPO|nr:uncharacterized protein GMORB2_6449 [Geosmithia morbida]KAF4123748.1 hypothetical protein GMORB2_6449 [Geosmithia morbida]
MVAIQPSSEESPGLHRGLDLRHVASIVARAGITDEKPSSTVGSSTLAIALGVSLPCAVAVVVLFYLHRRNVKRQRLEDSADLHRDLDFGIDESAIPVGKKNKTRPNMLINGEKPTHKTSQLSMDMNLESPYLLPPNVQGSHDSVHTLTRGHEYDPYRIVNSESGSIRSFNRDPSIFGGSSKRASVMTGRSGPRGRQGSFPRPPPSNNGDVSPYPNEKNDRRDPFATPPPSMPAPAYQASGTPELESSPAKSVIPELGAISYPDEAPAYAGANMPYVQEPPAAMPKSPVDRVPSAPPQVNLPEMDQGSIGVAQAGDGPRDRAPSGLGLGLDLPHSAPDMDDLTFSHGNHGQPLPGQAVSDNHSSKDGGQAFASPQVHASEHYDGPNFGAAAEEPAARQTEGLGVPQKDNRRISVGLRPLPPSDVTDSEDPEYRANRIRSFYKEYFEDTTAQAPPMPSVPSEYAAGGAQYYEDYDQQYLGDATYFDPDSNAFVMPGAQPVHRRAMTPPPTNRRGPPGPGPRGPGPRGPGGPGGPHGPHGSMSGMRPRAGSSFGGRAASSLGPRPDSSASARPGRAAPKKMMPPPAPLSTLPTPSKLGDDSFAIFNATDFAPPESFGNRAGGRSQSPMGERRPYSPSVPAASPLVTTYDELNALPSPHMMRKSSTFTGLDFLPPKKFGNADNASDAGSIRSNRSAISAAAQSAVRNGAGRVSRLPGDAVFTPQAMSAELKPQWGMRMGQ